MAEIAWIGAVVGIAVAAFALSVGVGMLVGKRLDRIVEAHHPAEPAELGQATASRQRSDEEVGAHGG